MSIAQRLYERGYITYMRTDSTNLSEQAITAARSAIREQYGEEYLPAEAARLPQQGEERAGGPRGDPARPATGSARPTRCAPSSTPTSSVSTS